MRPFRQTVRLSRGEAAVLEREAVLSRSTVSEALRTRAFARGDGALLLLNQLAEHRVPMDGLQFPKLLERVALLREEVAAEKACRQEVRDDLVQRLVGGTVDVAQLVVELAGLGGDDVDRVTTVALNVLEDQVRGVLRGEGVAIGAAVGKVMTPLLEVSADAGRQVAGFGELLGQVRRWRSETGVPHGHGSSEAKFNAFASLTAIAAEFARVAAADRTWFAAADAWAAVQALSGLMPALGEVCGVRAGFWPQGADPQLLAVVAALPPQVQVAAAVDLGVPAGWRVSAVSARS